MVYVVIQPSYNFAHFVPHQLLNQLHIPYSAVLWGEQNADKFLHFFGAAALAYLIIRAQFSTISKHSALGIVCLLCFGAEYVQWWIDRGYNSGDLLLGISGGFMAYLAIDENKC